MDPQAAFDLSGEALNRAVAVHVMGLCEGVDFGTWPEHLLEEHDHESGPESGQECVRCYWGNCPLCDGDEPLPEQCVKAPPKYSESSRLGIWSSRRFGQVIERLHALGWDVELRLPVPGAGSPQCHLSAWDEDREGAYRVGRVLMGGETIAEAVCRAALRAVLEYPDPTQNTEK